MGQNYLPNAVFTRKKKETKEQSMTLQAFV